MIDPSAIRERFAAVGRGLNERTRRLFAAVEARTAGYGGIEAASQATGIARSTIGRGLKDLNDPASLSGEVRRPGSGRPALTETDATLLEDLRQLLEPATKGDPMRPLRWVSKSHAKLAAALCAMGHQVSKSTIPKLLGSLQYCRQVNRKTLESVRNPDRDAQFEHINAAALTMQAAGKPVISIDTKKKEPIGPYKNAGSDYRPKGCPDPVKVHDFVDAECAFHGCFPTRGEEAGLRASGRGAASRESWCASRSRKRAEGRNADGECVRLLSRSGGVPISMSCLISR